MNNGLEDLTYSSEALSTRFLFYQGLNDINLFVEDTDMEYIYETIFKRLLEQKYNIKAIFPLGGKPKVKQHFLEYGNSTDGIKNFYIVDGDFDRYVHSKDMINDACFIYLKTYNIENYFLDENSCIQFSKGKLRCLDDEVYNILKFQSWKNRIVNESSKLFLCYCFIQKYYPTQETLSRSSYLFINDKTGFEREDGAYQKYWDSILELDVNAQEKINQIDTIYKSINGDNYFNLICGKFLFDSLCCYLRNITNSKFNKADFKWYLINNFDISTLSYVKEAILNNV